ncbi:putative phosphatidylinositol 3-kinase [Dioscorea sansibarensis]
MDLKTAAAAPDPSPSAPNPMQGEEWMLYVVNKGTNGLENPKVIEWDDLQQELARLCSLTSELNSAKERKEALAQRLESVIKVRTESLAQSNELEETKQRLEVRKLALSDLSMHAKRSLEDVRRKREQLGLEIRSLLVAGKTLSVADQQLQDANKLLTGKKGWGHLKNLQKMLRMREQYMISQVCTLYPVKASNDITSREKLDPQSDGGKSEDPVGSQSRKSSLTILGQQLTVFPMKKLSFFGDKKEIQRSATVLGYVAHAVLLIASYLDVPLRYPVRLGGSRSYVLDYAPSVETASSDLVFSSSMGLNGKPMEFPLFLEGQDTTRAAYAVFLLNKDLEQLLNYIGAESLGPRHVLPNLNELFRIIQSNEYINK